MAAYEFTGILSGRLGRMREPEILRRLLADEKGYGLGVDGIGSRPF